MHAWLPFYSLEDVTRESPCLVSRDLKLIVGTLAISYYSIYDRMSPCLLLSRFHHCRKYNYLSNRANGPPARMHNYHLKLEFVCTHTQ